MCLGWAEGGKISGRGFAGFAYLIMLLLSLVNELLAHQVHLSWEASEAC